MLNGGLVSRRLLHSLFRRNDRGGAGMTNVEFLHSLFGVTPEKKFRLSAICSLSLS